MNINSMSSKKKFTVSLLLSIFGIAITAAVFLLVLIAVKGNTEIRSKAATGNRQVIKTWDFSGTSVGNWKKSGGRGSFSTHNGSLLFYLFHQGTVQIKNSDEIIMPSGVKYIRFSMFVQTPITAVSVGNASDVTKTSIGGGGPCSVDRACPAGYRCMNADSSQVSGGRCVQVQPTQRTVQTMPLTIHAMVSEANDQGVSWKRTTIRTEVQVDGTFHTYDLKLTDRLIKARVKDIIFEFEDPGDVNTSKTAQTVSQEVKIDRITLEVMPVSTATVTPGACVPRPTPACPVDGGPCYIGEQTGVHYCTPTVTPKPSGACVPRPTPVCSPNGGPCYVGEQTGVHYCTPTVTPTRKPTATPTNKPITKIGPCWNKVFRANGTYNWPDSCRGMIISSQMCTQVLTPLTASEITAYRNWNGQPIAGCQ